MNSAHDHPYLLPITGAQGELVERFLQLIDREPAEHPGWWYNYGALVAIHFGLGVSPDTQRSELRGELEYSMHTVIDAGLDEAFLVASLVGDLDRWIEDRANPSNTDEKIDQVRQKLRRIAENPEDTDSIRKLREALASQRPEWANKTDAQIVEDARRAGESFKRHYVDSDEATRRWSEKAMWDKLHEAILPSRIVELWTSMNLRKAIQGQ